MEFAKDARKDPELLTFAAFLIAASIYYAYRLRAFAPWYDELYTYNFFISRGPVYAGIHWPVPNNHLGYSVLGGIIYVLTHAPYLSLRGISYMASVGNLIMLFMTGRKLIGRGFALMIPAIYAGAWQVNAITVQGRGYALSVNMMLIALTCLLHVCFDETDCTRHYVLWAVSMVLGFYTVMTTLYWVITVAFCALTCLLALGRRDRLLKIIIASVLAAVGTVLVYSVVWLAIGSNLMTKDELSAFYGMSHIAIILRSPLGAVLTGARYMLDTPYIQSVPREGYARAFADHFLDVFNHFYAFGAVLIILMALAVILAVVTLASRHSYVKRNGKGERDAAGDGIMVFSWIVIWFAMITPITVFVQSKLPYVRTFTYYAAAVAFGVTYLLAMLFGALGRTFTHGISLIVAALAFAYILSKDYNTPYGDKEEAILDLMEQEDLGRMAEDGAKICLTDCNQEYMYRFVYDEYPEMAGMEEADVIILDKEMLDPDAEYHWEFYYDYDSVDHDRIREMKQLVRNAYYEAYVRNCK